MPDIVFSPDLEFRIAYCEEANRNVLQLLQGNEWLCLHRDTPEEEQEEIAMFLLVFPEATLRGIPEILIGDLELIQGHLINLEMGIDICLWPTQPGDVIDKVLIRE